MCVVNFDYDGEQKAISIFDQNFDRPHRFHTGISDVSFEVRQSKEYLVAVNVHDEDGSPAPKSFFALNICEGGTTPAAPDKFINGYYSKWLRTLFANNRSLMERECPKDFQSIFVKSVDNWVDLFYQYRNTYDKKKLFALLSLAAKDIGKRYYDLAYEVLNMYKFREMDIPNEIGCAFCDLTNDMQKELMNRTLAVVDIDYKAIGILAKALWHNENFVYNMDLGMLLDKYFPKAVDQIGKAMPHLKKDWELYEKNVQSCMEFILGIMRLRNLNDTMITENYLSLNNKKMQELYKYLEILADDNVNFRSFLKLNIKSKGRYESICDLLYVMLVYVSGYNAEGEIWISLDIDD